MIRCALETHSGNICKEHNGQREAQERRDEGKDDFSLQLKFLHRESIGNGEEVQTNNYLKIFSK